MLRLLLLISMLAYGHVSYSQILEDPQKAFQLSQQSQLPVLLVFSGSDWCRPCIRFHKDVLSTTEFQTYADGKFIMLKADFPQRKIQAASIIQQNESLAERYNPKGQFPLILLLNTDQSLNTTIKYTRQNSHTFIGELKSYLQ